MLNRKALGKGMDALIPNFEMGVPKRESQGTFEIPLHEIIPNRRQPRKHFDDSKLMELVESIREKGVIQPIVVQKTSGGYEIIVGERRWRASRQAGLKRIPAVVKETSNNESLELAIIENIHRQDLNPIEEALAFNRLAQDFGLKQDQIAKRVGKNRTSIANYIRLLKLPRKVQEDIMEGRLSMGHARCLLAIHSEKDIEAVRSKILQGGLNVRQTENLVRSQTGGRIRKQKEKKIQKKNMFLKNMESELSRNLGTRVQILVDKKGGRLVVSYYSDEDLERLRELFVSKIA